MNEKDLVLIFTAAAVAGAAQNLQHPALATAQRCIEIGIVTAKLFIKQKLLDGVSLQTEDVLPVVQHNVPVPSQPGPLLAQVRQQVGGAIKGIPGDGTFSPEQLRSTQPVTPVTGDNPNG